MVTNAIHAATLIQIGKEITRGTGVAATRRILTKSASFRIIEELENMEGEMHGLLVRSVVAPVLTHKQTELEIVTDLDFEQILFPLLSGVRGGVVPTQEGGAGPAELWTFTPAVAADPLIDTYTLEYAERSMEASPVEIGLESQYGFVTAFNIQGGEEGVPQISYSIVARGAGMAASTASIALPTRTHVGNLKWTVFIDSTWAGLGTTQVSAQVFNLNFGFSDFVAPARYLDGRGNLDFSTYEFRAGRVGDLSFDIVIDPSGQIATEDSLKGDGTMRFVRIEILGPAFAAPDAGFNHRIRIDGAYYHAGDSMVERGGEREGQSMTSMHLLSTYDPTQAQDLKFSVQNTLATFP